MIRDMKKLLILLVTFISFNSYSQYVGDIHIKDIPSEYIIVEVTDNNQYFMVTNILVDYGQMKAGKDLKLSYLTDENGEKMGGKNRIGGVGVINIFAENGFELVETLQTNYGRQFVMKKRELK